MSVDGTREAPPFMVPVDGQEDGVHVYYNYTACPPFTPFPPAETSHIALPVYTGGVNSSFSEVDGKNTFVSYDTSLSFSPAMTTCTSCQQQVMSHVTYKAGRYAWMLTLIFLLGLLLCLLPWFLSPLAFMKRCKDAHHTCPRCSRVLHIEKRKFCK